MSEQKVMPCFVVFENDAPVRAFFDDCAAQTFKYERRRELGEPESDKDSYKTVFVHIHEIPLVDRRKGSRA